MSRETRGQGHREGHLRVGVADRIRVRKAKRLDAAFSNELPSGDAPPPETADWHDKAA